MLVACGVTASVWIVQHNSQTIAATPEDCAIVEKVGHDWQGTMTSIEAEILTDPGERGDWLAIADRESAMGDKLRTAADSVSTPAVKEELNKWADSMALAVQLQRDSVNQAPGFASPPSDEATFIDASKTMYEAAVVLNEACPGMLPPLEGN